VANEVFIVIPLVPPSVNHYKMRTRRGVTFVYSSAARFKEAVAIFSKGQRVTGAAYEVRVVVYLGKGQRSDLDNLLKIPIDGLVAARVIASDAGIMRLIAEKGRDRANPRTEITVKPWEEA
jgi:Holliday junction resolvase RusA-like endonuclease